MYCSVTLSFNIELGPLLQFSIIILQMVYFGWRKLVLDTPLVDTPFLRESKLNLLRFQYVSLLLLA